MRSRDFAYWLQGYFEIFDQESPTLSYKQIQVIKAHLAMVFVHEIDPTFPQSQQAALQQAHGQIGGSAQTYDPKLLARC